MNNTVELLGYYGSDLTHAQSAWTSTSRDITKDKRNRIPQLLEMLAKEGHHTPFEKSSLHFLVTVDQATHIHLLKHRIGVSINGESARYKELKEDKFFIPDDWPVEFQLMLEEYTALGNTLYHKVLAKLSETHGRKRAKESARFFKTFNSQISMDVMFNFRSFMHFLKLRYDEHAQKEVRELAGEMLDQVKKIETNPFEHSLKAYGY
jgi:thymidylate synthase (FAD)